MSLGMKSTASSAEIKNRQNQTKYETSYSVLIFEGFFFCFLFYFDYEYVKSAQNDKKKKKL